MPRNPRHKYGTDIDRHGLSVPRTVPPKAHPLTHRLFILMRQHRCTYLMLAHRIGCSWETIRQWRRGRSPDLSNIIAAYNVFGYKLAVVRDTSLELYGKEDKGENDADTPTP